MSAAADKGKTDGKPAALVTGGSRGIGRAIALRLAAEGFRVAVNYRARKEQADAVVAEIEAAGGEAFAVAGDVAQETMAAGMVAATMERYGRLDALVNNAGILKDNYFLMMSAQEFDDVLSVNLKGVFHVTRPALKEMVRRKAGGRVVNIVSVSGVIGTPGQANYSASKGGVIAMTRCLAREYGRYGILVNCVAPGFVDTDMTEGLSPKRREEALGMIPLARFGKAEEVAELSAFLASSRNGYMTGQTLVMDGGLSA